MGLFYTELTLKNPRDESLQPLQVRALADTGALMLCLPQHIASQLGLETQELRDATTADSTVHKVPYAGPVEVCFENRHCYVGALIMGDDVLLGAVPMEDMDLVLSPAHRKIVVNPESPNFPSALIK